MPTYWTDYRAFLFAFLIIYSFPWIYAHSYPNTANLSTSWTNTGGELLSKPEWMTLKPILLSSRETTPNRGFLCGFYCLNESNSNSCLFAILIFQDISSPQLVWSANRNRPVGLNASLRLTEDGNLMLADADGSFVWSTTTAGKSVSGLNLTENGNLMLFDRNNEMVWQSFDHPTDSLVLQQKLVPGKELISSVSASNWSQGLFSLSVTAYSIDAYVLLNDNSPQLYYSSRITKINYIKYDYRRFYVHGHSEYVEFEETPFHPIPTADSSQYIRFGSDGHLRVYQWYEETHQWQEAVDLIAPSDLTECGYPLVCGKYGICSQGQCTCPGGSANNGPIYFRPIIERQPKMGCSPITPISCRLSQYHSLLELRNTDYFASVNPFRSADMDICKQTCLNNCSCKAVLFKRDDSVSSMGYCSLLFEVLSFKNEETSDGGTHSTMFLKVENSPNQMNVEADGHVLGKKAGDAGIVIGSSLAAFFGVLILTGAFLFLFWKTRDSEEAEEEDHLDCIPGMPTRFSYEDLKAITQNFSCKLGQGGFGSVFQGTLSNGIKVAVKHLEGLGQVKKSFLAEVETIGSIHHVNLVRLIGFCAEKSHRLLVYEYMCNGSLDKWICHGNRELALGWE